MISKDESRQIIIENFHNNILGKYPSETDLNTSHEGKLGHWLETKLGGEIDSDGNADLNGFECKVESNKISWGDWGAPYRIFCDKSYNFFNKDNTYENMWLFVRALGVKREHYIDGIYYSMSGRDIPTRINDLTDIGLSMREVNKDILYQYSFSSDQRETKNRLVPNEFQRDNLLIYKWHGTDESFNNFKEDIINNNLPINVKLTGYNAAVSLEERIRRKFGVYGIVVGLQDRARGFYGLKFLKKISFDDWLNFFQNKDVFYDTALTTRNKRPYNQWRSNSVFMRTLEEEIYIP